MSQPSIQDLLAPFDPTTFTEISGAQLLQLISGAAPNTDIGFIVASQDINTVPQVPNAVAVTKWQNYLWLRVSAAFVTVYVWNPNGATDATYLNWVTLSSASIGPGTIQGYQIANSTITSNNILSISSALITGSVVPAWLAQLNVGQTAYITNGIIQALSPLFGDLGGAGSTLGSPTIANGVITAAKMALQSVSGNETPGAGIIKDNTVTKTQLLSNGQAAATALTDAAVDINNNIVVPTTSIIGTPTGGSSTQNSLAGDLLVLNANRNGYVTNNKAITNIAEPTTNAANRVLAVAANATVYSLEATQGSSSFGRILQTVFANSNTTSTISGNITDSAVQNANSTGMTLSNVTASITPVNGTGGSRLIVDIIIPISCPATAINWIYLVPGTGATAAVASTSYNNSSGSAARSVLSLSYAIFPGSNSAITYNVYFGCTSGSTTKVSANAEWASIKITEYI